MSISGGVEYFTVLMHQTAAHVLHVTQSGVNEVAQFRINLPLKLSRMREAIQMRKFEIIRMIVESFKRPILDNGSANSFFCQ
jgi:stalled ribosome rescue protein Dom34